MHRKLRWLLPIGAVGITIAVAFAGTPLPEPPFSSGGFIPPDPLVFKQEVAVGKILTKYAALRSKCDQKAVTDLQLAYEPANQQKVPEVQAVWTACVAKAALKYTASRDKQLVKGTPACLDQAGIDAVRAQIDAQFPDPIVYCDDDAAAPDPVTSLNIPDFKKEAEGEAAAARAALKWGQKAGKCYAKTVKDVAFKFGGSLPPEGLLNLDLCIMKVSGAGNQAMADLDQTQKLPDCLPLATAQSVVASAVDLDAQFIDEIYCASPSGAFVDGIDGR